MRNAAKRILGELCPNCQQIINAEREKQRIARRQGIKEQREASARARKMHLGGAPIEEVAKLFEKSVGEAKRMVLPGGQQGWRRNQSSLDLDEMQSLFADGHTVAEVSQMMDLPVNVVSKWLSRVDELSGADAG